MEGAYILGVKGVDCACGIGTSGCGLGVEGCGLGGL